MAFVVGYDANVLYPSTLRDVLIRVALSGLVQAKWTDEILDEVFRNVKAKRPDLAPAKLDRTRQLMVAAVRDCMVTGHEPLIGALELPDPDDRHVVAAAIRARAQLIVTFNLDDFPADGLAAWDIEAKHPDDFLIDQFHLDAIKVHQAVQAVADSWSNPPGTADDVLDNLERSGLPQIAAVLCR
ncbi:MAG: PIN domain-containing protein [Micromonosporaceae bacterium]